MSILVDTVLKKIHATAVPKVKKVALAFSGGLDSSLCVELLRRVYGVQDIVALTVNVGQGQEEMHQMLAKAKILNITPHVIDAREEFTQEWLSKAIHANSSYNGYPVSTSMTRQLIARIVAEEAQKYGCDALMEGSTGKGNDQYRMHNVFSLFAPKLEVLVPVRDFNLSRPEEQALCQFWNVPVDEQIVGGDDKTLWCRSIASGAIGLNQKIPDEVWLWLKPGAQAKEQSEEVTITFCDGVPCALNGQEMLLEDLVAALNILGGAHGIGLIDMCEDGIMGLKSREIYEAPAALILLKLHHDLELFCMTKEEIQFKKNVDSLWAYLVYHGMWYHPLKNALDAFIHQTQKVVNGTYKIILYKGTMTIAERILPTSLFFPEVRSITSSAFDQRWSKNAAKVLGLSFENLSKQEQLLAAFKN